MAESLERLIHLDQAGAEFFDRLKSRRNLKTDAQALQYCVAEAALSLATPEDMAGEDDPTAEEIYVNAIAHPETLTSLEDAFLHLRQELEEEHPGTYKNPNQVCAAA